MAEEIKQTLGFDASGALETLRQLDAAMMRLGQGMNTLAAATKNFNSLGNASDSIAKSFQSNTEQIVRSNDRLTTSLKLLSRIVFTQVIIRALSQLRRTFEETAESAIDFQRRLALIRTIDDSGQSFQNLGAAVRNLSEQFNIPLLQTADGLYQALSNQVGTFAESVQFSAEAAQFAKATNSSLADSIDLLSGALKSYNLSVEDTDRISSIFFKTIDLGRVNASELANTFGRVGPAAAQIGLSLEETGAAIAAISVQGSKTSESLTQFRNIITALTKPTPQLTKALRDLGFTSAETAIRTLELPGVLRELANSTGG